MRRTTYCIALYTDIFRLHKLGIKAHPTPITQLTVRMLTGCYVIWGDVCQSFQATSVKFSFCMNGFQLSCMQHFNAVLLLDSLVDEPPEQFLLHFLHLIYDNICPTYRSGDTLRLINVVTLRQGRLVPRWVTVFGRVNHLTTSARNQAPRPTQSALAQAE